MADRRFSLWWPLSSSSADENPSALLHMFIEDVHTKIMPYRYDPSSSKLAALIKGNEEDARMVTRLCAGLAKHSSIHDSPLELVSNAVRRVAQCLLWSGSVAFELPNVLKLSDEETLSPLSPETILPITGELLFRVPGRVIGVRTAKRREWKKSFPSS